MAYGNTILSTEYPAVPATQLSSASKTCIKNVRSLHDSFSGELAYSLPVHCVLSVSGGIEAARELASPLMKPTGNSARTDTSLLE